MDMLLGGYVVTSYAPHISRLGLKVLGLAVFGSFLW